MNNVQVFVWANAFILLGQWGGVEWPAYGVGWYIFKFLKTTKLVSSSLTFPHAVPEPGYSFPNDRPSLPCHFLILVHFPITSHRTVSISAGPTLGSR